METHKKIFFLFPRFGMGGISKSLSFVANVCANANYKVICASLSNDDETVVFEDNVKRMRLGYEGETVNTYGMFKRLILKAKLIFKLRRIIASEKPDAICVFGTDLIRIIIYATYFMSVKIIGSERGNPFEYTERQYKKYLRSLKRCERVVFQTEEAKKGFPVIANSNTVIIPNPCIQRQRPLEPWNGERKKRIVLCGRLSKEKNLAMAIRSFADIVNQYNDYIMRIYGNGPEKDFLCSLISRLGLSDVISIIENCNDVFAVERDAGIYILCSNTEGMPNALMEAMALGIPAIATDCPPGGVNVILDGGARGILVPVGDDKGLTEAILEYIDKPGIANYYGHKGVEIAKIFAPDIVAKKWLNLFSEILADRQVD